MTSRPDQTWGRPPFSEPNWGMRQGMRMPASLGSRMAFTTVLGMSWLFMKTLTKVTAYNAKQFQELVESDRQGRPLITVMNHECNIDDALVTSILPWETISRAIKTGRTRYIPASEIICFSNPIIGTISGLGRLVPVRWGLGVHQFGMRFVGDRLLEGHWINIFPEGYINQKGHFQRIKWGVAELIMRAYEANKDPIILPIAHTGLADMMPLTSRVRIPRPFSKVEVAVGEPFDCVDLLAHHKHIGSSHNTTRSNVADVVQMKLESLHHQLKYSPETLKK